MILRLAFLFLVSIENNQFLGNLLVFKDISIDNSMINTKVIILAIIIGVRRRCFKNSGKT